MRKLGIVLLILVALVVVAIVAIPLVVDANRYHGLVQAQLEKALGRPVTFGQMRLSLTPPGMRLENVMIAEDPQFGQDAFATAKYLDATVKIGPLLHGNVDIRSLELQQPKVQIIKNAAGVWNFSTLGKKKTQAGSGEGEFVLGKLAIAGGQVTMVDQAKKTSSVYNNIDLALNDYAPNKAFRFDGALHLPGAGKEMLRMNGTAGPLPADNNLTETPFGASLDFKEVGVGGIRSLANLTALDGIEGTLSGKLNARNTNGTLGADGSLELQDAVIRKVKVDYPITLDFRATDHLASDQIHIDSAKLHLGQTPIVIEGDVNAGATPAQLNLHVTLKEVSIEETARLASALGVAFNPSMRVGGMLTADIRAVGPANAPAMNGNIVGKDVRIQGGELKQPVDVGAMSLALTPQGIRSNPFTATSGSTKVAVQFTLANYTGPSPAIDATVRTAGAKLPEVLSIANAYGVSAAQGMSGTGDVNLDVHVNGPMKNTNALVFSGSGKIANASLKTPDLSQPLNIRNADVRFTGNSATLQNLSVGVGHTNASGNLTMQNFSAPNLQFNLNADKVNVAELQQIFAAPAPQKTASMSLVPAANAQGKAAPSVLEKLTGGGAVSIGTVEYDQLLMQNLKSNVALDHGIIHIAPLSATMYGGQQTGSITVDMRQTPMAVSMASKLAQVDANQLLSSVSSLKQTIYGLLAGNANASFRAASSQDIARTLNGTVNLDLTKGKIAHVDLLNQLAGIARFASSALPQSAAPFTNIVRLTGTFNIVNGLAQTNNLNAQIPGGSISAEGAANLATQGLDMHLVAVLTKDLTQQVGGTQVGGFMNTALANANGELVIPVLVSGSFDNPRFAPDLQKIAQMKLQQMLPTAANPGGAVSKILGGVLGGKNPQGQPGQQQGGLGGILGAITGQQQQSQPPAQPNQPVANPQGTPEQQAQPQPAKPADQIGNVLQQIMDAQKKKKQQQQQQPPPKQ